MLRFQAVAILIVGGLFGAAVAAQVSNISCDPTFPIGQAFPPDSQAGKPDLRFDPLRTWLLGLRERRSAPRVFLQTPKPSAEPVIALEVSTSLPGASAFQIDVDLNHDGRFEGPGELGYAEGRFDPSGAGQVRLHGLVHGRYQVRARVNIRGRDMVSALGSVEVLPTPPNQLPVSFEVNQGQTDAAGLFLGRGKDQTVYVTADETMLVAVAYDSNRVNHSHDWNRAPRQARIQRFRLVGANASARPTPQKKLPGISNYFIGNDPSKWRSNIETYQELLTRDVYPGIDLVYHSNRRRLEYDFHVAPGADPSIIGLEFPDAANLSIDADGGLVVRQADGQELRKSAPIMYQMRGSQLEGVNGSWVLKGRKQAGYVVADYDRRRELVIDPLVFSTYLGGTSFIEQARGIAVDGAGNSYVVGEAFAAQFPTTAGAFQPVKGGLSDAIILKLNPAGTAVAYATHLGGPAGDGANAVAADAAGNAYVTGFAGGSPFPTTVGAFQTTIGGNNDVFVTKLNPTGSALVYSTRIGGGP